MLENMFQAAAEIPTDRSERYAKQLLSHWGRQADRTVEDGPATTIEFDANEHWGANAFRIEPMPDRLRITVYALDEKMLEANRGAVVDHLQRFAGTREDLSFSWS